MLLELSAVARALRNTSPMLIAFFRYGAGEGKWWIKLREAQRSSSPLFLGLSMDVVRSVSSESARVMGDTSPVPSINWASA